MSNKKNLLLIESEMISPKGHFFDYLLETSNYFKDNNTIHWFLNKNFSFENNSVPNYCNIKKIIKSNNFNRKINKFFFLIEEFFFFLKNFFDIFYFILFFIRDKKKLFSFLKCLFGNTFIIPRYFKSFYLEYIKFNFNINDNIIFQSCRRKDIALVYFLYNIEKKNIPKIHLRIFFIPKKRYKSFYFYFNKIKSVAQNKIFFYTEEGLKKKSLIKELGSDNFINTTKPIFSFYNRKPVTKTHTVGFMGESRLNKGFNVIPKFIEEIHKINDKFKFIIHFSNLDSKTIKTSKILRELCSKYNNIEIIDKYCDFHEYRKILEKITIMPLFYDLDQIRIGSGILYSCISYQIIPIIPKNCDYLEEIIIQKPLIEAENLNDFVRITNKISNNYDEYLSAINKSSDYLYQSIKNDMLIKNIES